MIILNPTNTCHGSLCLQIEVSESMLKVVLYSPTTDEKIGHCLSQDCSDEIVVYMFGIVRITVIRPFLPKWISATANYAILNFA